MSLIEVDFPGNVASVRTVGDLRALPSSSFSTFDLYVVTGKGLYSWVGNSLATDDGNTALRPNDLTPLQAGRWLFGPQGSTGPADNTYSDLAAFKASDIGRKTASLVSVANIIDGRFNWTAGNYTGKADDANVIQSNNTPLSTGAWVRQTFRSLSFGGLEPFSAAIGTEALGLVTSGVRNTAFGYQALKLNATGNENTAFGYRTLASITSGTDPVANYNTAFGSFALASMTTGYKNTAVGRATMDMLTTGYQNTSIGYGAFHWGLGALNCVAVGYEAVHGGDGSVPHNGQGLVGVGFQALYEATGSFNTAVGTSAGRNITTGARNTALGTNALNQQVTASDNIGVGYGAGLNNTGSGNIFLGVNADAAAGLANVTVIGTGAQATLPNTFILGVNQAILPGGVASDIGSQAKPWAFGIFSKAVYAHSASAPTAGGVTGAGFLLSSTPNFGIFFGSGTPSLSAARGSLYLRTDGSSTSSRLYVNLDNGSGWTAVTTAS